MAKIIKVINDLSPDEALFWTIESNASITLQKGKPLANIQKPDYLEPFSKNNCPYKID